MKRNHTAEPVQDFGNLGEDAKELLASTAEVAEGKVAAARERLSAALERGRDAWGVIQQRTRQGAKATDQAIRSHPYHAMGIAFGVGALLGVLLARRGH